MLALHLRTSTFANINSSSLTRGSAHDQELTIESLTFTRSRATQYSIISEAQRNDGILNINSMSASAMPPQVLKDAIILTMPTVTLSLAKSIDKGLPHATAVERLGRQLVTMAGTAQQLEQTLDVYLHKQYYQNDIVEMYKKNGNGNSD
jgi:hypothetical protein